MNRKRFEYFHKDIKQLKIDIFVRLLFTTFFVATFIWQLVALILKQVNGVVTIPQGITASIVLISSLFLGLATITFAFKDFKIIATIKMQGKCVSSVQVLFRTDKKSFMWLYKLIGEVLTLGTTLVLLACITYSILEISYYSSISFYMPLIFMVCVAGYNAIYHVNDEIRTQQTVQEQQPLY